MKRFMKILLIVMAVFSAFAILETSLFIADYLKEYRVGSYVYSELLAEATNQELGSDAENPEESGAIDFDKLQKINPDIVGWIEVPDTRISYPIVKRENDNDYYLDHLFDGTENKAGCIFMDTRSSFGDTHVLIHGHNMGNGSMFRDLELFKNRAFFNDHPNYLIYTPEKTYQVAIFAGSVVRIDSPVWQLDFENPGDWNRWMSECRNASSVSRSTVLSPEDQIITLSTCSYEYTQARWVLQGCLKELPD